MALGLKKRSDDVYTSATRDRDVVGMQGPTYLPQAGESGEWTEPRTVHAGIILPLHMRWGVVASTCLVDTCRLTHTDADAWISLFLRPGDRLACIPASAFGHPAA